MTRSFRKRDDFSQESDTKICENMSKFGSKIWCENWVGQNIQKKRKARQQGSEPNGQGGNKGGGCILVTCYKEYLALDDGKPAISD